MGSGVKYRRGNSRYYVKIGVVALLSVLILYFILKWTSESKLESSSLPYLSEGIMRHHVF